jgi:predicted ATPase
MQKTFIKDFGPIQNAETEVKKILVLIGEQASHKSTIAKLIYFLKTLKDDLFSQFMLCSQIYWDKHKYVDIGSDILSPIREEFYRFFVPTNHLHDFEIVLYYSFEKDKYIK